VFHSVCFLFTWLIYYFFPSAFEFEKKPIMSGHVSEWMPCGTSYSSFLYILESANKVLKATSGEELKDTDLEATMYFLRCGDVPIASELMQLKRGKEYAESDFRLKVKNGLSLLAACQPAVITWDPRSLNHPNNNTDDTFQYPLLRNNR
jgi:hypothetical protein